MNDSAIVFPNSPNKLKDSFFVVYKKVESVSSIINFEVSNFPQMMIEQFVQV
jgi:hypothetical protein